MNTLLEMHLACCVPLAIDDLQKRGGPSATDFDAARAFGQELGEKGDQILYRSKETPALVSRLVRTMAVMAFIPGGVHFCGAHYEAVPLRASAPPRETL